MKIKKNLIISGVIALLAIILICSSISVVKQRERGVRFVFETAVGEVIQPGVIIHAPFVSKIKTYSIAPKTFKVNFQVGNDQGAITKDLQTVAAQIEVRYNYDEKRIMEIAKKYGDSVIESAMQTKVISSVKEIVGQYTIYELVEKQSEITRKVDEILKNRMEEFPILVTTVDITNWSWSDEFDKQIQQTAERTQQIKTAQQEAEIAAAQAQKLVKEAEAKKQAAELDAQAQVAKAEGDAKARKLAADATAYENQKIAQNMNIEQQKYKHEEQMKYYEKWNGELVPTYIPLTASGGIVNLK